MFSSDTPGFQASAATVPAGICFVTITADGGHGVTGDGQVTVTFDPATDSCPAPPPPPPTPSVTPTAGAAAVPVVAVARFTG
ncbi:MAG TPA: hypothetical protein VKE97_10110 [Acidimicrobiia bacterium]|nr:hypothetical protein [Acidimicrobiia bacterium]